MASFSSDAIDRLVRTAVFADNPSERDAARRSLRAAAEGGGAFPASIQRLYEAVAAGQAGGFTVPAFNLRGLAYDGARAIFRAARALDAGAFLFEISRAEMGYTSVRPAEFAACVLGAAIREGWKGPVFLQGDHFQFAANDYARDPGAAAADIRALSREAVEAGFYNIDIDASTLVAPNRPTTREQQLDNYERTAEMTAFIRGLQPAGVEISVGGEIGEVGGRNSTVEEFEAFFEGYRERYPGKPISKMSVQTGTAHGGVILPDGSRAPAPIDFRVLKEISAACRRHGLAGTVQHGASTLPESLLAEFPRHDAIEVHLATELQRIVFDHPRFPRDLRRRMERWVEEIRPPEWKAEATPAQNFERCAKRAWGPFRRETWDVPAAVLPAIMESVESKARAYFTRLNVAGTRALVEKYVLPPPEAS